MKRRLVQLSKFMDLSKNEKHSVNSIPYSCMLSDLAFVWKRGWG